MNNYPEETARVAELLDEAKSAVESGRWLSAKFATEQASIVVESIRLKEIADQPYRGASLWSYIKVGFGIVAVIAALLGWLGLFLVQVFSVILTVMTLLIFLPGGAAGLAAIQVGSWSYWPVAIVTFSIGLVIVCILKYLFDRIWEREDWLPVKLLHSFWENF